MVDVLELSPDGWSAKGRIWQPDNNFYAVLGDPIAHSLSPEMQNAALGERGLPHQYLPIRIRAGQLRNLKSGSPGLLLAGFNVTAPLKEAVSALCEGRTEQARVLGAVNTVRVENGKWLGHNTDSGGILSVLSQAWTQEKAPREGIILGAGGSARAAVEALMRWEVPSIEVWNRSVGGRERINRWLESRGLAGRVKVKGLPSEPPTAAGQDRVWVGCLAGGVPCRRFFPLEMGKFSNFFLDLRYGEQLPAEDLPLGLRFSDGLPVLLMQGGLSFAWWFGPPVPWQAMRRGLGT